MTAADQFNLIVIGERISPGYKSAKALIEGGDITGLQGLALKQAQAGPRSTGLCESPGRCGPGRIQTAGVWRRNGGRIHAR